MNQQLPGDPGLVSDPEMIRDLVKRGEQDHNLPVEHFFKLPEKTNFQLSPDGEYYAYLAPWERRMNIFISNFEGQDISRLTSVKERNISGFGWASNQTIIYARDNEGDENYHIWSVNIETKEAKDLTPFEGVRAEIIDILRDDDEHVLITLNKNHPQIFDPYRLNILNGHLEQLASNDPEKPIMSWMTNHDGKLLVATQLEDGVNAILLYRSSEDEPFSEVLRTDYKTEVRPFFFDFENPNILWTGSNVGRDKIALVRLDLNTGEEVGSPVFEHDEVDISSAGYSKVRRIPTTVSYTTDKPEYHFLDDSRAALQKKLEALVPGEKISVVSSNKAENKIIVRSFSDLTRGSYYTYDATSDAFHKICDISPWIEPSTMSSQKPISFTSRDGLTIHGYLTLPENFDGQPIPIVLNPHGGPWHRDTWGFNPEVQLFASRGYGVLQINFRGSTGYGRKFWEASFKQWGQDMQNDLTDGVQWLIDQGIADPAKVAIYGGSYGGYATLAGVCYTPELYCCAIDYVGVSNLFTFMNTVPPYWEPFLKMMYEMVGDPEADKDMMTQFSPALNADNIKVPLFVIQGANDPRVNIDESDQIVRNLRGRGIDVPYLVKYDEGHGFHNEENQFEVYKAMLGFLGQYLGS